MVFLAHCEFYFIREHENLVYNPSNNISIIQVELNGKKNALKEKLDELTTAQDTLKEKEEELDKQKKELSDTQVYIDFI